MKHISIPLRNITVCTFSNSFSRGKYRVHYAFPANEMCNMITFDNNFFNINLVSFCRCVLRIYIYIYIYWILECLVCTVLSSTYHFLILFCADVICSHNCSIRTLKTKNWIIVTVSSANGLWNKYWVLLIKVVAHNLATSHHHHAYNFGPKCTYKVCMKLYILHIKYVKCLLTMVH
jgi:hypothetical protein